MLHYFPHLCMYLFKHNRNTDTMSSKMRQHRMKAKEWCIRNECISGKSPYLPEFSSVGPFPLSFWTSLALLRFMEALSLENEPLRFILPVYISQTNTTGNEVVVALVLWPMGISRELREVKRNSYSYQQILYMHWNTGNQNHFKEITGLLLYVQSY